MKNYKIAVFSCVLSVMFLFSGCTSHSTVSEHLNNDNIIYERDTTNIESGFLYAFSKDGLSLYVNKKTATVLVKDEYGKTWYTNPENAQSDSVASDEIKQNMCSQASIQYSDNTGNIRTMNTYTDSVKRGQFSVNVKNNTISVRYTLGEAKEVALVPVVVEKNRFEEKIKNKVDSKSVKQIERYYTLIDLKSITDTTYRKEMEIKYPASKNYAVYVLRNNPPSLMVQQKIDAIVKSTEYTLEDLSDDNLKNGVSEGSESPLFNLTIIYKVVDGHLSVSIPSDKIEMPKQYLIEKVRLLENFGSAYKSENGYMLLPDGSGSLMYFNNGKSNAGNYSVSLYGADKGIMGEDNPYPEDCACLPVFGLKTGDNAFLGVIEQGDALANINARSSGAVTDFNTVYPEFRIREKTTLTFGKDSSVQNIYQKERYKGEITVSYFFLNGEKANYIGMAKKYRSVLFKDNVNQNHSRVLLLTMLGVIDYKDNIIGIPVNKKRCLTTFSQSVEIIDDLKKEGLSTNDMVVRYIGWANGGLKQSTWQNVRIEKLSGGKKELLSASKAMETRGTLFFPDTNPLYVQNNSLFDGFTASSQCARFLNRSMAKIYPYNPATFKLDTKASMQYLVSPRCYLKLFEKLENKYKSYNISQIAFSGIGSDLGSDYREDEMINREDAKKKLVKAMSDFKKYTIMSDVGNSYILPFCKYLSNVPMDSCGYDCCDESIPFFQLTVSGIIQYTGKPYNLQSFSRRQLMKAVETGAGISYAVMASPDSDIRETEYHEYYSCNYDTIKGSLCKTMTEIKKADETAGREMISHQKLQNGVYKTVFDNGKAIIVNYNHFEYKDSLIKIPAESFVVV